MNKYLRHYTKSFYKSKEWKDKRQEILQRDNYECQMCKEKGRVSNADTVHHIKHYKDKPSLALTNSNLISLCNICHNKVHPEKFEEVNKNSNDIHKEKFE